MVEVLSYTKSGNNVTINDYLTYPLPEECVINGVILDGTPIVEGLKSLNSSKPQLFNDVSLVIDGSFVYTKRISVPSKLNKWAYDRVIRDEFFEISSDAENLICDYFPLSINPDGSKQILACAVERAHAETYFAIFRSASIEPKKVRLGEQAILQFINSRPALKEKPFVLNIVDDDILMSMIFQKGVSVFQSRTRLYGDTRPAIIQSTLDGLSGIIQFNRGQNFDDINNCLYLGLSNAEIDNIRANNAYPDIIFNNLELFKGAKGAEILPPHAHFAYLNALIPDSEPDLFYCMKMLEKVKKRNRPKKLWIPILAGTAGLIIAITTVLIILLTFVSRDVKELEDYMNSQKVQSEKAEIVKLNSDINAINARSGNAQDQIDEDNAKPLITRELVDTIIRTGGSTVDVTGFSFGESEGTFRVSATAIDELSASGYVDRLRADRLIEYVEYLGYSASGEGFGFSIEVKAY